MKIYVGGSMRQRERIHEVSSRLRAEGFDIFNDWIMPGEEADEKWQQFEQLQARDYLEALYSPHATNVFEFDKRHLDASDIFVLVYPAGKSAHTELGYMVGKGKPGYVLLDGSQDRWDVMLRFADGVTDNIEELVRWLQAM